MDNYIYIETISKLKKIGGAFFLLFGIIGLIFINFQLQLLIFIFFIMVCFVGIVAITAEGIEIDFNKNRYRSILSIYNIKINLGWLLCPKIEYICLVETKITQRFGIKNINASTRTISTKVVKINVFDINEKYKTIYFASSRKEALIISENMNRFYNVEILNNFN